ncbi:unnamed protein product, partial [Timema podura]|nr:unnamed protein product [Timema podura]
MVGLHLPLVPMKHAYVITENISGVRGLPNVRDHDASVYFRIQGESLCMGGYEPNPIMLDQVPADFQFGLYELDWTVFSAHMSGAVSLVPVFATAGIKSTVCGPESFTPDHKPIIEVPEAEHNEQRGLRAKHHGVRRDALDTMHLNHFGTLFTARRPSLDRDTPRLPRRPSTAFLPCRHV